ncbi:MAG: DUF3787 domain-containing protein [Clostridium sp.]|uniref:CDIF630_02480 family spore surface protein n=1 Tax=Clostridium sp. TaxID=1506 RepID=UPI0029077125|nr:DUF3787 domain-containing protein [Clostridium sp.]MDU7337128.1 DUF3787 domain-containing protein [Clostridium sp.]
MLFHKKDKDEFEGHSSLNSAAKVTGPGPERDDTDKITIPITYPDKRYRKTKAAMPSDQNVEIAKEWVDFNTK